jgi:hypothetical protein
MITLVTPSAVLAHCRTDLGLPSSTSEQPEAALLAGLVRRAAGIYCPCSRATLAAEVVEGLSNLVEPSFDLRPAIDEVIEGLIIGGDLLELDRVTTIDSSVTASWVFVAPPSYVVRRSGSVFLFGFSAEDDCIIPPSLAARIRHENYSRVIDAEPHENLPQSLRDVGLVEVSAEAWLRSPKENDARALLDHMQLRLAALPPSGEVEELSIIDPERRPDFYSGRRVGSRGHSGMFVARRPQAYGSPIWGYAQLDQGELVRFLDLPLRRTSWRGCDSAWHLQMAIDCCNMTPQLYRTREAEAGIILDFFSPLPLWAERRLAVIGRSIPRDHCLLSYLVPTSEADEEVKFLEGNLWLAAKPA